MNEQRLTAQKQLGFYAGNELAVTKQAWLDLRQESLELSISHPGSRPDDVAVREAHRADVKAIDRMLAKMEAVIANARAAKRELDSKEGR